MGASAATHQYVRRSGQGAGEGVDGGGAGGGSAQVVAGDKGVAGIEAHSHPFTEPLHHPRQELPADVRQHRVGENRINTAHFFAEANLAGTGPEAAVQTVRDNFGLTVNYYVRFNFDGFKDIVNAMGGINIEIQEPMSGYEPGIYRLDGDQALAFVRDRQSSDDFFRMQRGQMMLKAAVKQMLNPLSWPRIPLMITTGLQAVNTNVPFFEIPRIGVALVRAIISDSINSQTITREMVYPTITADGANILIPNWDMINPLLLEMFGE